jgi:hypothetical protein
VVLGEMRTLNPKAARSIEIFVGDSPVPAVLEKARARGGDLGRPTADRRRRAAWGMREEAVLVSCVRCGARLQRRQKEEGGYWWRTAGGSRQLSRCSALSPIETGRRRRSWWGGGGVVRRLREKKGLDTGDEGKCPFVASGGRRSGSKQSKDRMVKTIAMTWLNHSTEYGGRLVSLI